MSGHAELEELRSAVSTAVEFASEWEEPYRAEAFRTALAVLRGERAQGNSGSAPKSDPQTNSDKAASGSEGAIAALARELDVDPGSLRRVIHVEEDQIQLLFRVDGESTRGRQTMYSAIYCYIKEKGFNEMQVGIEELRDLCKSNGCYDAANFTANFRRDDRLSEIQNGRKKRYMATKSGLAEAKEELRRVVTGE